MAGTAPDLTVNGTSMTLTDEEDVKVTVADVTAMEGKPLIFTVKLERAVSDKPVTMRYTTQDGTAKAGVDYTAVSGKLTFASGEIELLVEVPTLDDSLNEGSETLTLRLSGMVNASSEDPEAIGTITNDDELPRAWIARFGRTMASHVMKAVDTRLHGVSAGSHLTVGGVMVPGSESSGHSAMWPESSVSSAGPAKLTAGGGSGWTGLSDDEAGGQAGRNWDVPAWDAPMRADHSGGDEREMSAREVLAESTFRFRLTSEDAAPRSALRWTAWGSGASTSFDGRAGRTTLNAEVVGMTLGLDAERGRWTAGMAIGYNDGRGSFDDAESGDRGELSATLASVHPYLRWGNEHLSVWGLLGHGQGEYVTTPESLQKAIQTDLYMNMAGVGVRRALAAVENLGDLDLALRSDAVFVWMHSDAVSGYLQETRTHTSHVRLLLEGGWAFELGSGRMLTPAVEAGLRHDAGDAETGSGLEVGGSLGYAAHRLTIEVGARGLVTHEERDYKQWGVGGALRLNPDAAGRGLSIQLAPSYGQASSEVDRLWTGNAESLAPGAANDDDRAMRLEAEIGYSLGALGGYGLVTPYVGLTLTGGDSRNQRLGARWAVGQGIDLSLEVERSESETDSPDHGVLLSWRLSW